MSRRRTKGAVELRAEYADVPSFAGSIDVLVDQLERAVTDLAPPMEHGRRADLLRELYWIACTFRSAP